MRLQKHKILSIEQFFIVLLIYLTIQSILKSFYPGVEYDDAEQFLLYQNGLQWIYPNAQPPLYNWLQYLFFKIFGLNIFALSLLKHTLLFFIYYFSYKVLIELNISKTISILGSALMFLLPQVSWGCELKLSHSVLLLLLSVLTIYYLIKLKKDNSLLNYILIGIIVAFGILSKYSYFLFIASIFIATIINKDFRSIILNKKFIVTIFIIAIIILPHFFYVYLNFNNTFLKIANKVHQNHTLLFSIKSLILAILAFLGPLNLIIIWLLKKCKIENKDPNIKFLLLILILNLILIVTLTIFGIFDTFKERWLLPYLFLVPIILVGYVNKECLIKVSKTILNIVYFFMFIMILIFILRLLMPDFIANLRKGRYSHDSIDYKYLKNIIQNKHKIACNDLALCGNLKLIFPKSEIIMKDNTNSDIYISTKMINNSKVIILPCKYGKSKCLKLYIKEK